MIGKIQKYQEFEKDLVEELERQGYVTLPATDNNTLISPKVLYLPSDNHEKNTDYLVLHRVRREGNVYLDEIRVAKQFGKLTGIVKKFIQEKDVKFNFFGIDETDKNRFEGRFVPEDF